MRIHRRHALGLEEARRRVELIARELQPRFGLTTEWSGDELLVSGRHFDGRIQVAAESIDVTVELGLLLAFYRAPIRGAIEAAIDEQLAGSGGP